MVDIFSAKYGRMRRSHPRSMPSLDECFFYHKFDLPDGTTVQGPANYFDLRGQFSNYIGNVDVSGKTVLDVGTASGFLAFSAEEHGASDVVAFDSESLMYQQRVPFEGRNWHEDKPKWAFETDFTQNRMFNGFWYMWHAKKSKVGIVYGALDDLYYTNERFDIVVAGAIIEHLSDPVSAIGHFCRLARETVVIAFTPVHTEPGEYMKPLVSWSNPDHSYVWWVLSEELYRRVFDNLGYDMRMVPVTATIMEDGNPVLMPRVTIVAHRRAPAPAGP